MKNEIKNYLCAGYPGIYVVSPEETRVESILKSIAEELKRPLFAWSTCDGLTDTRDGTVQNTPDPIEVLNLISEMTHQSVILLRDFHLFLEKPDPYLLRTLRNTLSRAKDHGLCLVILGCRLILPPELDREWVMCDFTLPEKRELGTILTNMVHSAGIPELSIEETELVLESATGLTCLEAENAFALSIIEFGYLSSQRIGEEKAKSIGKLGILEFVKNPEKIDNIGGLDLLKDWLFQRKNAFGKQAHEYGLPTPKGLLIVGIPGTGKSLTAKATASIFARPLLKLDIGRLFGGLVGQSESNLRSAIRIAEAIAPCVLWVDEIEKGFHRTGGASDGGTSARVLGLFLTWMQEKTKPVFVVATANSIDKLPPEFLRKGRFDEIFNIDLPDQTEREAIWKIQIRNHGRSPDNYDLDMLMIESEGLTGAEIEQVFVEGLFDAFNRKKEPTTAELLSILRRQVPLSRLMEEEIQNLRSWARKRTRPATTPINDIHNPNLVVNN
jgi:hypothetical protein